MHIRIAAMSLAVLAAACQAPAVLTPDSAPSECFRTEHACVDGDLKPTGFCCPETYACGGAFPNVGCEPGYCCPTQSGNGTIEFRRRVNQRRAAAGVSK